MTEYQKQLKSPKWQKKRLEILDRDGWTCQVCEDTEATLTVHHKSYRMEDGQFVDIWDYDNSHLITLCEECHSNEEECLKSAQKDMYFFLRDKTENFLALTAIGCLMESLNDQLGRRVTHKDIVNIYALFHEYYERLQDNNSRWFSLFVDSVNSKSDQIETGYLRDVCGGEK